ncbi:hypothetical protein EV421DRAFT_1842273 [Armillaria borealis]|uniref:Secreted protein n=1 Tax=Armillaria borealis TaxID=47425 RepID=A0AA39J0T7_9AGAR|nr:hypothetical protein EV421DRAFT_1842273 [Armillaria borealis]
MNRFIGGTYMCICLLLVVDQSTYSKIFFCPRGKTYGWVSDIGSSPRFLLSRPTFWVRMYPKSPGVGLSNTRLTCAGGLWRHAFDNVLALLG